MQLPTIEELLKAGVHFGHKTSKWHPSMSEFIFGERRGVHIINLRETLNHLEKALNFISQTVTKGGTILILGTKKQAQEKVSEVAKQTGMPSVTTKWIGGTITNWTVIKRQILKLKKMRDEKERGEWQKYTKKERVVMQREIDSLISKYGGIETMDKHPDALFIVDCKESKTAIYEARSKNIPLVAICDTNVDIRKIDYPIPANDDAIKSLNLILNILEKTILHAQGKLFEKPQELSPEEATLESSAEAIEAEE